MARTFKPKTWWGCMSCDHCVCRSKTNPAPCPQCGGSMHQIGAAMRIIRAQAAPALAHRIALERDAARYQWLRERDLDQIQLGGVFAGQTPQNLVLNQEDLDHAIDAAMQASN